MKHGKQDGAAEPRPSALNMTLPAFAAERGRLQEISIDDWYTVPTAIDRPAPALSSKRGQRHVESRWTRFNCIDLFAVFHFAAPKLS